MYCNVYNVCYTVGVLNTPTLYRGKRMSHKELEDIARADCITFQCILNSSLEDLDKKLLIDGVLMCSINVTNLIGLLKDLKEAKRNLISTEEKLRDLMFDIV